MRKTLRTNDGKSKVKLPIQYTCQCCKESKQSTRHREIYTANYMGPCGDSFCFASCDSETCRPISVTVCDECEAEFKKKEVKKT